MFLHLTVNTFTDKEWGYGDEDPNLLNPAAFDPDAIVSALAVGGMRGVILTCKHHGGSSRKALVMRRAGDHACPGYAGLLLVTLSLFLLADVLLLPSRSCRGRDAYLPSIKVSMGGLLQAHTAGFGLG